MIPPTPSLDITENEVHLWLTSPEAICSEELLARYEQILTKEELNQRQKFHFPRHRHQYLVTRAMVRTLLSHYNDTHPAAWRFSQNSYGKPEIQTPRPCSPLRFNLSHTDGLIVCGVALEKDIGVDVENVGRPTKPIELGQRFFSEQEYQELMTWTPESRSLRFYEYWVLKESYIKACGKGLSIPLSHAAFHLQSPGRISVAFDPARDDRPEEWQFWLLTPTDSHKLAISLRCTPKSDSSTLVIRNYIPLVGSERVGSNLSSSNHYW